MKPPPPPAAPVPAPRSNDAETLQTFLGTPLAHFAFDRADLTAQDRQRLRQLATLLGKDPNTRIQISGNADERGTEEYNLQLGSRRAAVAKRYLVDLGIAEGRIDTISYGKERPVDPAHDEKAWAANRRDDGEVVTNASAARS